MAKNPDVFYKENRLKTLRAFCKTVETGNISAAAEKLFLSQPTVSLQIKALEKELGAKLFDRHGPRIELTPEGQVLYELARPLIEDFERLDEKFHAQFERLEGGELHIAAGETVILHMLPEHVRRFSETYPRVQITLHNVTGRAGMEKLQAGEADFAVGSMQQSHEDFFYRPILTYDLMLIMPPDHPLAGKDGISLEDIAQFGLILPPRHLSTWKMVRKVFHDNGLEMKVALETGGWEVVKKYVKLGMGISIVSGLALEGEDQLVKVPLRRYFRPRSYGIIIRKGRYLSRQAKLFIGMIDPRFLADVQRRERLAGGE